MTGKGKFQTSTSILLLVEFCRISGSKFYWLPPEKENTICIMPHCALLDQKTQVPWIYCLFNKSKMLKEHVASKAPTNSHSIGGEAGEAIMHNYCPSVTKKLIEMHHEVWSQLTANALSQSDWGHTKHCSQCKRGLVVTMNYTEGILGNVNLAWCTLVSNSSAMSVLFDKTDYKGLQKMGWKMTPILRRFKKSWLQDVYCCL